MRRVRIQKNSLNLVDDTINDVITKTVGNADLGEARQIAYHWRGLDESHPKRDFYSIQHDFLPNKVKSRDSY